MLAGIISPIITGVTVSLVVFFVTRYYSAIQAKKSAEMERKETERLETAKRNSDKIDALTELCKATAQHKIIVIGNEYIKAGVVTASERGVLRDIYKPYKALGGNSIAKAVMDEVEHLPVVAEE